ncbi:hypothetical protein EG327_007944 [Venturia inaequalis]|uniref:Uncharacterized protein n=1 Tax=Venturia inaequalis TaxID=5025 RepID=A0A8H3VSE5_VENIN|nr:hypothetical protein EG327_007944 [Venturia inaequalis]
MSQTPSTKNPMNLQIQPKCPSWWTCHECALKCTEKPWEDACANENGCCHVMCDLCERSEDTIVVPVAPDSPLVRYVKKDGDSGKNLQTFVRKLRFSHLSEGGDFIVNAGVVRDGDALVVAAASVETGACEIEFGEYFDAHLAALQTVGYTVDYPTVGIAWTTAMDCGDEHWEKNSEKRDG